MGNKLDSNSVSIAGPCDGISTSSLSVTRKAREMNGCFMLKVKKLKVPEKSLEKIAKAYPDLELAEL